MSSAGAPSTIAVRIPSISVMAGQRSGARRGDAFRRRAVRSVLHHGRSAMPGSVIVSSARTPIGKLSGALGAMPATDLGAHAIRAALARGDVGAEQVDY